VYYRVGRRRGRRPRARDRREAQGGARSQGPGRRRAAEGAGLGSRAGTPGPAVPLLALLAAPRRGRPGGSSGAVKAPAPKPAGTAAAAPAGASAFDGLAKRAQAAHARRRSSTRPRSSTRRP
jgi:hypothetical protein